MFPALSFKARIFVALVGISAITSLAIGLVLYYFAGTRLVTAETEALEQRSRIANAGAAEFITGLRNPEDRTIPRPESYAEELVRSVDLTGLGVLYVGPGGEPLAARSEGEPATPEETYERLGIDEATLDEVRETSEGLFLETPGEGPRYTTIWPLAEADGDERGFMIYYTPRDTLDQTLASLRWGILGAIGASIILAGAASLALARQITRPLSKTRDAAIRVASGDYRSVPVDRRDELGELSEAFNYMAEEIEDYVGEIQEQKSRLEAVLAASPEAVVATDKEGRVTMANPAAARMLGVRMSNFGNRLEALGVPDGVLQCMREAAKTGTAVREIEDNDKTLWAYAAQMGGEREGTPAGGASADGAGSGGIILAVRDITEHRSLERSKTAFVSDVSHELRTPLTTIQSAVDLIGRTREKMGAVEHRALELAEGELERVRGMVEELLTLAQMDSWQYALEVGPANLTEVIQSSIDSVEVKAERFGIDLSFDDAGERPCVCDAGKLYQVFLNLLDNAIKYSDPGARVEISLEEDEGFITVRVKDTGSGIPQEDLPQLFERFYRVSKDRSRSTGGSGLGLAISREIVELHGGNISVESELGVGSEFDVHLPKAPLPRSANYAI